MSPQASPLLTPWCLSYEQQGTASDAQLESRCPFRAPSQLGLPAGRRPSELSPGSPPATRPLCFSLPL